MPCISICWNEKKEMRTYHISVAVYHWLRSNLFGIEGSGPRHRSDKAQDSPLTGHAGYWRAAIC